MALLLGVLTLLSMVCGLRSSEVFCNTLDKFVTIKNGAFDITNCKNSEIELGNDRSEIKIVNARNNSLQEIGDLTFVGATKLTKIILTNNQIQKISCDAFDDQIVLTELILNKNRLQMVRPGTLDSLIALNYIDLSENHLVALEKFLFTKNLNLEKIDLQHNKIIAADSLTFDVLKANVLVNLTGNRCADLEFSHDCKTQLAQCFDNFDNFYFNNTAVKSNNCYFKDTASTNYISLVIIILLIALPTILLVLSWYYIIRLKRNLSTNDETPHGYFTSGPPSLACQDCPSDNSHTYVEMCPHTSGNESQKPDKRNTYVNVTDFPSVGSFEEIELEKVQ